MSACFGIDLGTANCCVGIWRGGSADIILPENEARHIPSYVSYKEEGLVVGDDARHGMARNARNTIHSMKRLLGTNAQHAARMARYWSFKSTGDELPVFNVEQAGSSITVPVGHILALLLRKVKEYVDSTHQAPGTIVLAVPGRLSYRERQVITTAATSAGLLNCQLVTEAVAVAVGYGFKRAPDLTRPRNAFVFNMGAGHLDLSIIQIAPSSVKVLAQNNTQQIGGQEFDNRLVQHFTEELKQKKSIDITGSPKSVQRLRTDVEKCKHVLSTVQHASIEVDGLFEGIDLVSKISREKFQDLCADLFKQVGALITKTLDDAQMRALEIEEVLVVGGASRMAKVQELLHEQFKCKDLCRVLNQDEAVAFGATICAAVLGGAAPDKLPARSSLQDCTRGVIGLEVAGGVFQPLIESSLPLPASKAAVLATVVNNQTTVIVPVLEEYNDGITKTSRVLTYVKLSGLPALKAGALNIVLKIEVASDNVVNINASSSSGQQVAMSISDSSFQAVPAAGHVPTDAAVRFVQTADSGNGSLTGCWKKRKTGSVG